LSIQILQYEFLGPVSLDEWGPPMEKLVYLIMSRDQDKFEILYVGDCEKTDDASFFTAHPSFKCWVKESISEKSLHLAILPLFDASTEMRKNICNKIISRYNPICNSDDVVKVTPDYAVRKTDSTEKFSCPCCGSEMKSEKLLEKSTLYRCTGCGISDTKLNS
jgi:predicted RNA-binding Zn-ribbon protein involved in translation (DUF1610 family)